MDANRKLVFFVLLGAFKGQQGRVSMSMVTDLTVALEKIYKVMGCEEFRNKPPLMYSMKGTGRVPVCLQDTDDWDGLRAHVRAICKTEQLINITIKADDDYMNAIHARLSGNVPASGNNTKNSTKKGAKAKIVDLDSDQGAIVPDEVTAHQQQENDELATLKRKQSQCPRCGDQIYCKINKHGVHVKLSHNQLAGWATALVSIIIV
ncbi:hypothetical protein K439DRAFT_1621959 [Ramaria rubella]|nr:hypothetical protein K439DRAFT_1621959 [Ramaria rubella]